MTHAERFLADIEAFLTRSGMSATAFGMAALNDPSFVPDLRSGRKPNLGLVDRVHAFMDAQGSPSTQPQNDSHDDQDAHADGDASAGAREAVR